MGNSNTGARTALALLVGFSGNKRDIPEGFIILPVVFGSDPSINYWKGVEFLVVKSLSAFNVIIGRPTLHALDVVVSTKHLKMKFPMVILVGEILGDQVTARSCSIQAVRGRQVSVGLTQSCDTKVSSHVQPTSTTVPFELIPSRPDRTNFIAWQVGNPPSLVSSWRETMLIFLPGLLRTSLGLILKWSLISWTSIQASYRFSNEK